jgi:hypothetical protein
MIGTQLECITMRNAHDRSMASRGKGRQGRQCVKVIFHEQIHNIIPYVVIRDAVVWNFML